MSNKSETSGVNSSSKSKLKNVKKSSENSSEEENEEKKSNALHSENTTVNKEIHSENNVESDHVKTNSDFQGKIIYTQIELKENMIPSNEELEYRNKELEKVKDPKKFYKMFKCTKCNWNFENLIKEKQEVNVHPLLDVLMCQKCFDYYGDGDFSLDSDNEDKYCRWCGEGGTIYTCSKCICGFCSVCIKKHFGVKQLMKVKEEDEWLCYLCNPKPLWHLRFICFLAKEDCESKKKELELKKEKSKNVTDLKKKRRKSKLEVVLDKTSSDEEQDKEDIVLENKRGSKPRKKKYNYSSSSHDSLIVSLNKKRRLVSSPRTSEESDNESLNSSCVTRFKQGSNKVQPIEQFENILKLFGYQLEFGMHWNTRNINQLEKQKNSITDSALKKQCKKMKWFLSTMCSYIIGFSNSLDNIEKMLSDDEVPAASEPLPDNSVCTSILKFLGFMTNQVKMFNEKGIDISGIMEIDSFGVSEVLGSEKKAEPEPNAGENVNTSEVDDTAAVTADAQPQQELSNSNKNSLTTVENKEDEPMCTDENNVEYSKNLDEREKKEDSQPVCTSGENKNNESEPVSAEAEMDNDNELENATVLEESDENVQKIMSILNAA